MGTPVPPLPVKVFVGMLTRDLMMFDHCAALLSSTYGPIDRESSVSDWTHSCYYEKEMGTRLYRKFISFERLFDPMVLVRIKQHTNVIESSLSTGAGNESKRSINLDPGYVTEAKVVLASTKDFSHRIYIGEQLYAEATLIYRKDIKGFASLEHTYPEFRTEYCKAWFDSVRRDLHTALKRATAVGGS